MRKYIAFIFCVLPMTLWASNLSQFFGGSKNFFLMKGDGVTKVGPVITYAKNNGGNMELIYLDLATDSLSSVTLDNDSNKKILGVPTLVYFATTDCTGSGYINSSSCSSGQCYNPSYDSGRYFAQGSSSSITAKSYALGTTGACQTYNNTTSMYILTSTTPHAVCGDKPCRIKFLAP